MKFEAFKLLNEYWFQWILWSTTQSGARLKLWPGRGATSKTLVSSTAIIRTIVYKQCWLAGRLLDQLRSKRDLGSYHSTEARRRPVRFFFISGKTLYPRSLTPNTFLALSFKESISLPVTFLALCLSKQLSCCSSTSEKMSYSTLSSNATSTLNPSLPRLFFLWNRFLWLNLRSNDILLSFTSSSTSRFEQSNLAEKLATLGCNRERMYQRDFRLFLYFTLLLLFSTMR